MCKSLPLYGPRTILTRSLLPYGLLLCHPWKQHVNLASSSMGTLHVHIDGNFISHRYLVPLATLFCQFFFQNYLCGLCGLALYDIPSSLQLLKGTHLCSIYERDPNTRTQFLLGWCAAKVMRCSRSFSQWGQRKLKGPT